VSDASASEAPGADQDLVGFAAAASHDLGTPLRLIAGYTDMLAERVNVADPEVARSLDVIRKGVGQLQAIVDGLLTFARTDDELEVEQVDAAEVVAETLAALAPELEAAEAEVNVGELPEVLANRGQLYQVFQNLITNAIKFRAEEPPRIDVACQEEPGVWHFTIADNGVGIAPQDLVRIFDLFGRSRATREREGSGIGLAVIKRVIERHGGGVWAESEPGHGSTFHFTLPRQLRRAGDPQVTDSD
jgi:signal transduction histidine kinase